MLAQDPHVALCSKSALKQPWLPSRKAPQAPCPPIDTKAFWQHGRLILVPSALQCGDFYEAIGIDAVLLVQFAGLNPMGGRKPPQAGCPKQNIRRVLADLVDNAALSVVRPCCKQCMVTRCSDSLHEQPAAATTRPIQQCAAT